MIAWFLGTTVGRYLVAGAAIAAATALALWRVFAAGKRSARTDALETTVKNVEKANEARRDVDDAARRGTVPERLRKFYID